MTNKGKGVGLKILDVPSSIVMELTCVVLETGSSWKFFWVALWDILVFLLDLSVIMCKKAIQ